MLNRGITLKKFFIETFGCTANISASELMSYLLFECGYEKTKAISNADFVIVNTCIVKAPTENKIKNLIQNLYNQYPLIITGCLPQIMKEWCKEFTPKSPLVGVDHFGEICEAAKAVLNGEEYENLSRQEDFCFEVKRDRARDLTGIIEISKGCSGKCTYCAVKLAKGPLVSKSEDLILHEARNAINDGCKELWLTAQDTASYGFDIKSDLPTLIREVAALSGDFKIRVGMMNPDNALPIVEELKEIFQHPKVYSFAHIPLQSGSNNILKKMQRKYTVEEFYELIKNLREAVKLTLSTDIIVGFPGETQDEFEETITFIQKVKFDVINISKYGDRKGTVASRLRDKLPTEVIKERSSYLTKIVNLMTLERNKQWLNWEGEAIALRKDPRSQAILFRNKYYKLIAVKDSQIEFGKEYKVKIEKALKTRLLGKLV